MYVTEQARREGRKVGNVFGLQFSHWGFGLHFLGHFLWVHETERARREGRKKGNICDTGVSHWFLIGGFLWVHETKQKGGRMVRYPPCYHFGLNLWVIEISYQGFGLCNHFIWVLATCKVH